VLTDLRILLVDTGRVWWRLLPVIMAIYLLGWLGSELTLRLAVIAGAPQTAMTSTSASTTPP
jgi:hypothetical protein